MKICLLLPAYNESKTIGQVIQETSEFINEIIVIDDGSSDETAEIAAACSAVCLTNPTNCGKGHAVDAEAGTLKLMFTKRNTVLKEQI